MQFYKDQERIYEEECLKSNVSLNICYNYLMYAIQKYSHLKNKIQLIERLDFNDGLRVKMLLNKADAQSKTIETAIAVDEFTQAKVLLFSWLDKTSNPYFFILQPFFKAGAGIAYGGYGYVQDKMSGIKNLHIAEDYANYKLHKLHKLHKLWSI